jgi:hypothetical protein
MQKGILVAVAAASLAAGVVLAEEIGGFARAAGTALMDGCRDMMSGGMMGGRGRGQAPNDQWRGIPGK